MTLSKKAKLIKDLSGKTWFKVLKRTVHGALKSCHGGVMLWSDPGTGTGPLVTTSDVKICYRGLHVTNDPLMWEGEVKGHEIFVAEIPWGDPDLIVDAGSDSDKIAVNKLRLKRATNDQLLEFGIVDNPNSGSVAINSATKAHTIIVKRGEVIYHGGHHHMIHLVGTAKLNFGSSWRTPVTGHDSSTAYVESTSVRWQSEGQLELGVNANAIVEAGCPVVAGNRSVVTVRTYAYARVTVYAKSGSVVIAETDCHIIAEEGAHIVLKNGSRNVLGNRVALLTADGQFSKFMTLDGTLSEGQTIRI